jgi:hypothetical protein
MGDIVVTSGLEEPYAIPYTDPDNAQSLRNLLIGKFAFLGSEAGVQLKNQTLEMQKVVDSVNYVSDILDQIKTPLIWSDKPNLKLNLDNQVGISPSVIANDSGVEFTNSKNAYKTLINSGLYLGLSTNYSFIDNYTGSPILRVIENTSIKKISSLDEALQLTATNPSLILTFDDIDSPSALFYNGWGLGAPNEISRPEAFVVPKTKGELLIWEQYPSILQAFNNTKNILLNESILYTPGGDKPDLSNVLSAKININANMVMVKDSSGGEIPYSFKKVSPDDKLIQDIHTVFILSDDTNAPPKYYFSEGNGVVKELNAPLYTVIPFVYNPTTDEVQSWRSQFAEKQVQLTQKSATLQNFLNELIQIYNYTFEAATNLLRAFSSLLSDISRNL